MTETHYMHMSSASSACGKGYGTFERSESPTCVACARYAELRSVVDRQAKTLLKVVEKFLPPSHPGRTSAVTWESLLDDLDKALDA